MITKPFELATHETTIEQFRQFADAERYRTDVEKAGTGGFRFNFPVLKGGKALEQSPLWIWRSPGWEICDDRYPAVHLTQADAIAFCAWLSKKEKRLYRLPTWAEWQWANAAGRSGNRMGAPCSRLPSFGICERAKYVWNRSRSARSSRTHGGYTTCSATLKNGRSTFRCNRKRNRAGMSIPATTWVSRRERWAAASSA